MTNYSFATQYDGNQNYTSLGTMGNFGSALGNGFYCSFQIKTASTANGRFGTVNATNEKIIIGFNEDYNLSYSSGLIALSISDNSGNRVQAGTYSPPGFNDGNLHTITIGVQAGQNYFSTFTIDGASVALNYQSQGTPSSYVNFGQSFTVGAVNANGTVGNFFACTISNFQIGTSSSVLYGNYPNSSQLGGSSTTLYDVTQNKNNGTLTGSPLPLWIGTYPVLSVGILPQPSIGYNIIT